MKIFGNPLELAILDVDGVIIDFYARLQKNLIAAAESRGLPTGPVRSFIRDMKTGRVRLHAGLQEAVEEFWPVVPSCDRRRVAEKFRELEAQEPPSLLPGSVETIHWLRAHGAAVALCTTNERPVLERKFVAAGIKMSWFDAVSTRGNGYPTKPHAEALAPIFSRVAVRREHAVYVGDSFADVVTARGAGVKFLAVLSGGTPAHVFLTDGVPQNHILGRLADIRKLVE